MVYEEKLNAGRILGKIISLGLDDGSKDSRGCKVIGNNLITAELNSVDYDEYDFIRPFLKCAGFDSRNIQEIGLLDRGILGKRFFKVEDGEEYEPKTELLDQLKRLGLDAFGVTITKENGTIEVSLGFKVTRKLFNMIISKPAAKSKVRKVRNLNRSWKIGTAVSLGILAGVIAHNASENKKLPWQKA